VDSLTVIADPPNVCLTLSNRPENVLLVRETLSGMGETVGVDDTDLHDIRTAVTEACNNVVIHAYEGEEGPLRVEVYLSSEAVEVVVRDNGTGIKPRIRSEEEEALGIGLSIIQALAPRVEFKDVAGGGTEVRMEFTTPEARGLESIAENGLEPPAVADSELVNTTGVAVGPNSLARTVFPRMICVLAARAHFSTDRISDAELVADALAAQVPESSTGERLTVSVCVEPRNLELRVGPLSVGGSQRLMASSSIVGPVIEKLTDSRQVATLGTSEMLELRLIDQR
jgi:serine/threonine-protein kinase RsbW